MSIPSVAPNADAASAEADTGTGTGSADRDADHPEAAALVAPRRRYRSPHRQAQAEQTRAVVLRAAATMFVERGWAGTSMREVAREAGVAVETVYSGFGSKAALLKAVTDVAIVGDDDPMPLDVRPQFLALAEGDLAARARATGAFLAELRGRTAALHRVLIEGAGADDGLREQLAADRATEWESTRQGISAFAGRQVSAVEVDVAFAILGDEVYLLLTGSRGWTPDQYRDWVADTVLRLFVPTSDQN